jgi:hypothetical protein
MTDDIAVDAGRFGGRRSVVMSGSLSVTADLILTRWPSQRDVSGL